MSSDSLHTLTVEFSTEAAFRSEYASNIANGGIFIATQEALPTYTPVLVDVVLMYCSQHVAVDGEVVHSIPAEMASAGATPGMAIQFARPARELRALFEPFAGPVEGNERISKSGRRAATRTPARIRVILETRDGSVSEAASRDISSTGIRLRIADEPVAIGETVQLTLHHPLRPETMQVEATVARQLPAPDGRITGLGLEFHSTEARQTELDGFIQDVRKAEHSRRLGGITGPIAELGIVNLLQMFGSSSPMGTLTVSRETEEGEIVFEGGVLLRARLGSLRGREALKRMLSWKSGSFEFEARVDEIASDEDEPQSEERIGLEAAILAAVCEIDESRHEAEPAPAAPRAAGGLPARISAATRFETDADALARHGGELDKLAEAVVDLASVGMSVAKILDIIPESEIEVLTALDELIERGILRCL